MDARNARRGGSSAGAAAGSAGAPAATTPAAPTPPAATTPTPTTPTAPQQPAPSMVNPVPTGDLPSMYDQEMYELNRPDRQPTPAPPVTTTPTTPSPTPGGDGSGFVPNVPGQGGEQLPSHMVTPPTGGGLPGEEPGGSALPGGGGPSARGVAPVKPPVSRGVAPVTQTAPKPGSEAAINKHLAESPGNLRAWDAKVPGQDHGTVPLWKTPTKGVRQVKQDRVKNIFDYFRK